MADKVLVTGVSGFIAKHAALQLLQKGYEVRGTVRSLSKAFQVKKTLEDAGADVSRLSFVAADLTSDEGWDEAAEGCGGVMHVASPFPVSQPRDRDALTPAARDGALRVLKAAEKAGRIVMTSSMAAMVYHPNRPPVVRIGEDDWTDLEWRALSPYIVSKTAAEKAAWDAAVIGGFKHRLTVVNPSLVLGPPLDDDIGASLDLIKFFMTGAYPAIPPVSFPIVDVRDAAALHVAALETPEAGGRRLIASADTLSLKGVADILREAFPDRAKKIPSKTLPSWLVRALALFDRNLASVVPDLGVAPQAETDYVTALTDVRFRPAKEAVIEAGAALERLNVI
ncbi:NAD-dependent epimerase/dehydratase family protein [Hyphococcus luteus]|uniref:Epimerase n=1 Tax=Hyphococcus luteus TaxID=2058213 RepID=A0A2S7JYS3_9PROT|nr:NAD-dependent epimerase/dehydratase family protein [Marinicaulis flavus]PQA85403.1 epimerase [Marinicaulis flavus]